MRIALPQALSLKLIWRHSFWHPHIGNITQVYQTIFYFWQRNICFASCAVRQSNSLMHYRNREILLLTCVCMFSLLHLSVHTSIKRDNVQWHTTLNVSKCSLMLKTALAERENWLKFHRLCWQWVRFRPCQIQNILPSVVLKHIYLTGAPHGLCDNV